jgi:hypothetical protein
VVALRVSRGAQGPEVRWEKGRLQSAETVNGPWQDMRNAVSPLQVDPAAGARFFRVKVEE